MTGAYAFDLTGTIVEAIVVRSNKHSLEGELTVAAKAAARPLSGAP